MARSLYSIYISGNDNREFALRRLPSLSYKSDLDLMSSVGGEREHRKRQLGRPARNLERP